MRGLLCAFPGLAAWHTSLVGRVRSGGQLVSLRGRLLPSAALNSSLRPEREAAAAGLLGIVSRAAAADVTSGLLEKLPALLAPHGGTLLLQLRSEILLFLPCDATDQLAREPAAAAGALPSLETALQAAVVELASEFGLSVPLSVEMDQLRP